MKHECKILTWGLFTLWGFLGIMRRHRKRALRARRVKRTARYARGGYKIPRATRAPSLPESTLNRIWHLLGVTTPGSRSLHGSLLGVTAVLCYSWCTQQTYMHLSLIFFAHSIASQRDTNNSTSLHYVRLAVRLYYITLSCRVSGVSSVRFATSTTWLCKSVGQDGTTRAGDSHMCLSRAVTAKRD